MYRGAMTLFSAIFVGIQSKNRELSWNNLRIDTDVYHVQIKVVSLAWFPVIKWKSVNITHILFKLGPFQPCLSELAWSGHNFIDGEI